MIDRLDFIESYLQSIERELNRYATARHPASLYEPCRYFLQMGGKRIRPVLTQIGCGMSGGDPEEALPAAIAVELIHNFTLVHDDIMDCAPTRRGRETVHLKWGNPTAILAGDILFTDALDSLGAYDDRRFAILNRQLIRSIRSVCEGQARDMELETRSDATITDYFEMIRGKTAALISGSLVMGGMVADASEEEQTALRTIGELIGVTFQIQDDLMDVSADPEQFGKTVGGDILEKKRTYLFLAARTWGDPGQVEELDRIYHTPSLQPEDVNRVIELFHSTGAMDRAKEEIQKGYDQALAELEIFGDSRYKRDLVSLVNHLHDRES